MQKRVQKLDDPSIITAELGSVRVVFLEGFDPFGVVNMLSHLLENLDFVESSLHVVRG